MIISTDVEEELEKNPIPFYDKNIQQAWRSKPLQSDKVHP